MATLKPKKKPIDFTQVEKTNPAKVLSDRASELYAIEDPQVLADALKSIIGGEGAGAGAEKYLNTIDVITGQTQPKNSYHLHYLKFSDDPAVRLKKLMSDYILKGSGIHESREGFVVTRDVEVALDGERYLLEAGDIIVLGS